jgi:hypothetical protein
VSFGGGAAEICAAMGTEVISLGSSAAPAAVTLANGIKPLCDNRFWWPTELHEVARQMTVLQVAHGQNHGVAATLFGSVYTWGSNDLGQLGTTSALASQADENNHFGHAKALAHHKIISVAAGHSHSVALSGMLPNERYILKTVDNICCYPLQMMVAFSRGVETLKGSVAPF